MNQTLQALADPNRRQIVDMLRRRERTVGALAKALPIAQSGVSRHLRILRDAGLVQARKRGQQRIYSLRPEPFQELASWLEQYRQLWELRLDSFELELKRRKLTYNDPNKE